MSAPLKAHVSPRVYRRIKLSLGGVTNLKIPGGDKITVLGYRLARKVVKFN